MQSSRPTSDSGGRPLNAAADFHQIYRDVMLREFWWEARFGLQIAFYRTYAVPSIARLLLDTGELTGRPLKRGYDTGIIMYELIYHGFEDPRGREVTALLNRMHRTFDITDEEYRYVLGTLIFIPNRLIDRLGHRKLQPYEREAAFYFYRRLGECMNLRAIPATIDEYEEWFDQYERDHFAFDRAAKVLIESSTTLATRRVPRPLRWLARATNDFLLDEPMREALGIAKPSAAIRLLIYSLIRLRATITRIKPARSTDFWRPGQANPAYPNGYTLDMVGPGQQTRIDRR